MPQSKFFIHCFCHSLNLAAAQDCLKEILMMRNVLGNIQELSSLIQFSPKRRDVFKIMRLSFDLTETTLLLSRPTRCSAKAKFLESVLHNYEALLETLLSIAVGNDGVTCLEVTTKASGIHTELETYDLSFCHSGLHQLLFINRLTEYNLIV